MIFNPWRAVLYSLQFPLALYCVHLQKKEDHPHSLKGGEKAIPKGYAVGYGWRGLMPSGEWRTFATEDEYLTAYHEAASES